jgi:ABC-2 type transport system ATP-binding protein
MVSDRVAIMHRGELVRQGTVADLTRQANRFSIGLASGQAFPTEEVQALGYRVEPAGELAEVELPDSQSIDRVLSLLAARGLNLRHLVEKKQTLEDVFVKMVETSEPGPDRRGVRAARPITTARRADR